MKQLAVYTVIINQYDQLLPPVYSSLKENIDFFCITDDEELQSDFYQIIRIERKFTDPTIENRYYKINSHPVLESYKYTMYLDGSVQVISSELLGIIKNMKKNTLALFRHPKRTGIYQEGEAVIRSNKEKPVPVIRHLLKLKKQGYPKNNGMAVATIILRNNQSTEVKQFNSAWWQAFLSGPKRDQLSFNYVLWKENLKIDYLPGSLYQNPYFLVKHHNSRPVFRSLFSYKLDKLKKSAWVILLRIILRAIR